MCFEDLNRLISDKGIIYLSYGGFLNQSLISEMINALEQKIESSNLSMYTNSSICIIFIEISQNIMNYATSKKIKDLEYNSEGLIVVGKDDDLDEFYIYSQNTVAKKDMEKIKPKLEEISKLSIDELKKKYRELRRSGKNGHSKGAGIGFYEIAKKSKRIEFDFIEICSDKYCFQFKSVITQKTQRSENCSESKEK